MLPVHLAGARRVGRQEGVRFIFRDGAATSILEHRPKEPQEQWTILNRENLHR